MRAFVLEANGRTPTLRDVPPPTAETGELVVDVIAAGLNPVDLLLASGSHGELPVPRTVGMEAVVSHNGSACYAERTVSGGLADKTVVPTGMLVPLPTGLDPAGALALGVAGTAGWLPVEATLRPGETVIVLGATGGAGQVAVQAAKLLGAKRVVAAGRDEASLKKFLGRGADAIAVLRGGAGDSAALLEATGGGADVVFDPVFGPPLAAALGATKPGGRAVSVGLQSMEPVELPFMTLFGKSLRTHSNTDVTAEKRREVFLTMARHVLAGELVIDTEVLPLDQVAEAWQRQGASPRTKLVLKP